MQHTWLRSTIIGLSLAMMASPAAANLLYQTGFERPAFVPGLLQGQGGWYAFDDISTNAATVSTDLARVGDQSLRVEGSALEAFPPFGMVGFYDQNLTYDPLASGTRFVGLAVDINASGPIAGLDPSAPLGAPGSAAFGIALDGPGFIPLAVIGVNIASGRAYAKNIDNVIVSDSYQFGEWARLEAIYDFQDRTVSARYNGNPLGEIPFTNGIDGEIVSIDAGLGVAGVASVPGLVVHADNISVATVPEPPVIIMLGLALASAFIIRCRRQSTGLPA